MPADPESQSRLYRGWYTIILYPGAFVAHREVHDEDGVVHTGYEELDGESAEGGPVVLSWEEAQPLPADEVYNVVVHEFAHKLDESDRRAERTAAVARRHECRDVVHRR